MSTNRAFHPAWWLPGPHLQTLGARLLRSRLRVGLRRERVELPDGDFVDLDWAPGSGTSRDDSRPLAIVLHGLEGSAVSGYALESYVRLTEVGIDSVGLNFRSCSGETNRLARFYHSGDTGDVRHVVDLLRDRFPRKRLGAIGVSLGGNVLLKYLAESGATDGAGFESAVAISVPYDLAAGAGALERRGAKLYATHFLGRLKAKLAGKLESMPPGIDSARGLGARTVREFDDAVTAPLHGFADAADYYRRSSTASRLGEIRTRTLLIHAADDPFLPPACIPRTAVERNRFLESVFTARGGHIGFVAGRSPLRPAFWAERRAAAFLARELSRHPDGCGNRGRTAPGEC